MMSRMRRTFCVILTRLWTTTGTKVYCKKLTFSSLPVAERFFKQTIHDANFLGKALKKLTPEEMEKFGEQIDAILDGTDNYVTRKNLLIACFAYIKEKREEVAYAS